MNQTYSNANSYSMSVSVVIFEKSENEKPLSSYSGKVAKSKESYFSEMMGKVTIYNSLYYILIDNNQKLIMFRNIQKNNKTETKSHLIPMSIDSFMYANSTATYLINTATEKRIRIVSKSGEYSKIDISIDPVRNVLTKIVFYVENKDPNAMKTEKIIVNYNDIKINNSIPEIFFSEKKYFTKSGEKIKPSEGYKSYQIIDENKSINNN